MATVLSAPCAARSDEPAKPESFDTRVALAKRVEDDPAYKSYMPAMYGALGDSLALAMSGCFNESPNGSNTPFAFIADIDRSGAAGAAQVMPATQIATCFQRRVSTLKFPKPPDFPGRAGFPIVIEMKITP